MKQKVGRPKGTTQTHKTFKLNNDLLEYWISCKNKNKMLNEAIKMYRELNNLNNHDK